MFERRRIILIVLGLLVLALPGCVASYIYYPELDIRITPSSVGLAYTDVTVETSDGVNINAWWVPVKNPRATVLFCHGNGGNVSYYLETLKVFKRLGLSALIFDYRGYGRSQGKPSEQGTYLDAEAAWQYLTHERKIAPQQLIIWGRSLGGAIAARTAARHPTGLLIIESAFTSVPEVAHAHIAWLPAWVFAEYRYDTRRYVEQITMPTLIIHSSEDEIIPFAHGRKLFETLEGPKVFLAIKGSHNQGFIDSLSVYEPGIDAFIRRYAGGTNEVLAE
ncbi:MAG: alpha/beta fold hydrolase [Syntrophaceae bacterium]